MVKICQTGLLKWNFETKPKKRIFRFLPKISAGHGWSQKFFFDNFQILGPLGCQGWVVIPQHVKKSKNHCTLMGTGENRWMTDKFILKSVPFGIFRIRVNSKKFPSHEMAPLKNLLPLFVRLLSLAVRQQVHDRFPIDILRLHFVI